MAETRPKWLAWLRRHHPRGADRSGPIVGFILTRGGLGSPVPKPTEGRVTDLNWSTFTEEGLYYISDAATSASASPTMVRMLWVSAFPRTTRPPSARTPRGSSTSSSSRARRRPRRRQARHRHARHHDCRRRDLASARSNHRCGQLPQHREPPDGAVRAVRMDDGRRVDLRPGRGRDRRRAAATSSTFGPSDAVGTAGRRHRPVRSVQLLLAELRHRPGRRQHRMTSSADGVRHG